MHSRPVVITDGLPLHGLSSKSGTGINSRARRSSSGISTRPECPSRRRQVSVGSTTCAGQSPCSNSRNAVYMWTIVKVTSMNSFVWLRSLAPASRLGAWSTGLVGNSVHTVKSKMATAESAGMYVIDLHDEDDAMCWTVEVIHKILKSGCRADDVTLRSADRLANRVAVCCMVSWRIPWTTMMACASFDANPQTAMTPTEIAILDQLIRGADNLPARPGTLLPDLTKPARLGGYRARMSDPPPGNTVIWRGRRRLSDIQLGAEMSSSQLYR